MPPKTSIEASPGHRLDLVLTASKSSVTPNVKNIDDAKTAGQASAVSVRKIGCGFTSGVLQAYVFNPWDRALYLSVKVIEEYCAIVSFVAVY
jgi:hypothetical protein